MTREELDDLLEKVKEIGTHKEKPRPYKISKELSDRLFKMPKDSVVFDPAGEYHEGIERMLGKQ